VHHTARRVGRQDRQEHRSYVRLFDRGVAYCCCSPPNGTDHREATGRREENAPLVDTTLPKFAARIGTIETVVHRRRAQHAVTSGDVSQSPVTCDRPGLIVSMIRPTSDGRGPSVRRYEGHGTRGPATLTFAYPIAWAEEYNPLEDRLDTPARVTGRTISLDVLPYSVRTLRVGLSNHTVWARGVVDDASLSAYCNL
jgi:hypothetical protein